jgi:hypothetical protein
MDHQRFDAITRAMAGGTSRRRVLKGLAGGALGGLVALVGMGDAEARRCRPIGRNCRAHADCCTDHCNNDGDLYQCTCPPGLGDCDGDGACETDVTTVTNCGACGNDCSAGQPANTIAACTLGQCSYACRTGFGDCDGDLNDDGGGGCETNLNSFSTCGSCTNDCATRTNAVGCSSSGQCICRFESHGDCRPCNLPCFCGYYTDVDYGPC